MFNVQSPQASTNSGATRPPEPPPYRPNFAHPTEHLAKLALFQAFDERATPDLMKSEVRVRNADMQSILETLGLAE